MSYNQYRSIGLVRDSTPVYNDIDFTAIEITADIDFDETHPAGSSLADVVRLMSWSPYPYILSGYSQYYHYDKSDVSEAFDSVMRIYIDEKFFDKRTDATCYPVDKIVKDLVSEDMVLLGYDRPGFIGVFHFEKSPSTKDEFTVTVKFHTDNGKILTSSVRMAF